MTMYCTNDDNEKKRVITLMQVFTRIYDYKSIDLSISYDYGSEINGVASLLSGMSRLNLDTERQNLMETIRLWLDQQLLNYRQHFLPERKEVLIFFFFPRRSLIVYRSWFRKEDI